MIIMIGLLAYTVWTLLQIFALAIDMSFAYFEYRDIIRLRRFGRINQAIGNVCFG